MSKRALLLHIFGPKGVPPQNPTVYDDPVLIGRASDLVENIRTYWRDEEYGPWLERALVEAGTRPDLRGGDEWPDEYGDDEDSDLDFEAPFRLDELAYELGFPDPSWSFLADVVEAVLWADEDEEYGVRGLPVAIATDAFATLYAPPRERERLRLAMVPLEDAERFIELHHQHLPYVNPRGLMYAIGLKKGAQVVAVATAGTPTGRWKNPNSVLELTRIASDGSAKGASSKLASRMIDLLPLSGRNGVPGDLFVTYSLGSEMGTTYLALADKGLRPTASLRGKVAGGSRKLAGEASLMKLEKVRWEAGPRAAPADWSVLEGKAPEKAIAAARKAFEGWRAREASRVR